jgi:hypothetical protein
MMASLLCAALALASPSPPAPPASEALVIETAAGHPDERAVAETARRSIERHKLERWLFTRRIRVDREAPIPHSHPVLTLNTGTRDENEILSNLLHEQFHWLALADQKRLGAVVRELRARYPGAPDGPPEGARNLDSTYLHLAVNRLELEAMERIVGRAAAEKMLRARPYYRWIYRTVVEDRDAVRDILARNGLVLP